MCRVEERIYVGAEGRRSKFEEAFPCDKSRGGRLCAKVKRRTTEYYPKNGTMSRDDTPSPVNPPTPNSPGTYLVQQRRPSASSGRPSTRDGQKAIKPEIIIEFGSKKGKSTKYPSVSVSAGTYKRSSLGGSSVGSNDIAADSPGSDASHTIRTGFPDAPLSPSAAFSHNEGLITISNAPRGNNHHRHTSSASSFTGSSRTPSLYVTSDPDYDSPSSHSTGRYPSAIVHNPPTIVAPPSPSKNQSTTSTNYRTTLVTPQGYSSESHTPDGLYPLDYSELADRSGSSHASSGAPEITRRGKDRDERRKKREEERKQELEHRQELERQLEFERKQELELERLVAEELAKAENVKQVRFELGRAEARAQERAEKSFAEKEKARAEDREEARRRKEEERKKHDLDEQARRKEERDEPVRKKSEREETAPKERKKEKSKPPTTDIAKRPAGGRRLSLTQAQLEEQRRLLAAEGLYMQDEREAAEAREREERNVIFRQQQEQPGYYDPRGGDRSLSSNAPTVTRRPSQARNNSATSNAAPAGLGRSNSNRRTSIVQPSPPSVTNPSPQNYSARQPSARQSGPPVSFPANFNQDYNRPPSARRSSYAQDNPFAAPATRGSGPSQDNPFAATPSVISSAPSAPDPWDVRVVQDALPSARQPSSKPLTLQRNEAPSARSSSHTAARQASRAIGRAAGYEDDYDDDSDSSMEDRAPVYATRVGMSGKGKKKY